MLKNNALHLAAQEGNIKELQFQVRNFDIDAKGEDNGTALYWAAREGRTDAVNFLLTYNPDVNIPDKHGQGALQRACQFGREEVALALMVTPVINVNHADKDGSTALILSCINGNNGRTKLALALIKTADIDVNLAKKDGSTALIVACEKGIIDIVRSLIAIPKININHANNEGLTALTIACKNGHVDIVHDLIAVPAINVNHVMSDGNTSLHIMAQHGHVDVVVAMLNAKTMEEFANVRIKNNQGKTCFDVLKSAKDKLTILTKIELDPSLFEAYDNALWFVVIKVDEALDDVHFTKLLAMVKTLLSSHLTLAAAKDADGHDAMAVASKPMISIMQSVLLWHGRYRLIEPRPEHISATCSVFKAVDEHTIDKETNQPVKVALKLMRLKDQFQREISIRNKGFNEEYVMHILQTHPQVDSSMLDSWPNEVKDETDATGQLTKTNAENFFLLVMPLADRNLFVALKQERWAGKNMEEVRHVFIQLVHCVEHMHEKGVLHADLKTLNIVRTAGQWKLIDLDAACVIGGGPVGHKSSSAYVPPEAIYIDEKTDTACVRSVVAVTKGEASYELLTAHPSFDVWSLGCILYQMCTPDVKPVMQGGQDDNLVGVRKGVDNLFALAEWTPELKADKLVDVPDKLARNLLSQMLHKDPLQRPSLSRVLAHSFLSGKKVARLVGEKPKYDVFLSYRVASDAQHVEKLYSLLFAHGFKVYWDKLCLEPGVDWEEGFCAGLMSSRAFVPLLSRDAINHPDKAWQNFSKLTADQLNCDNVFLEHRLAVELQGLGLIEKMFPVFIGDLDATISEYSDYFKSGCHPSLFEETVKSVEDKLRHHMESQALGTPVVPDRTVKSVVDAITACQGAFIVGPADATFAAAAESIVKMLTDVPETQTPRRTTCVHQQVLHSTVDIKSPRRTTCVHQQVLHSTVDNKTPRRGTCVHQQALLNTMDSKTLMAEISKLKTENGALKGEMNAVKDENGTLKDQKATALASLRSGEFDSVEAVLAHVETLLQG